MSNHELEHLWDMNNHIHITDTERYNFQNYGYIVAPACMHLIIYLSYKTSKTKSVLPTLTDHSSIIMSSTAASVNDVAMRTAE